MEGHGSQPVRPVGTVLRARAESAEGYVAAHLVSIKPGDLPSCGRSHCVFPADETTDGNNMYVCMYACNGNIFLSFRGDARP